MAQQFPAQHQAHLGQMPPHQNIGQQRQNPMAQHTPMTQHQGPLGQQPGSMGQQKGMLGQQTLQSSFANYDPQLALFTFEKPKGADSWEDVEAEQQHVTVQDLQNELKRFHRNKGSVKRELNSIPSANCRRLINELVEDRNHDLEIRNRTLKWNIAVIDIDWKEVNRRQRQLRRVSVILQTGPSGYADPMAIRGAAGMAQKTQQMQSNQGFQNQQNQVGHDVPQLQRNLQQPMGHIQQQAQQMRPPSQAHAPHGQVPPPPPPPPGMSDLPPPPPGTHLPRLPPPPPGAIHGTSRQPGHGQQQQQQQQQQQRPMPGGFPEAVHRPAMRQGQPQIEVLDQSFYKKQKKHKAHHDDSSSDSESDSDEWDTESGDSVPDRFRGRKVEHGEFVHIGKPKRGRSRKSSQSKKSRHAKSHSKLRSRSRSHVRPERRRRRDSDHIEPPPMGKYSPMSSKDSSPRSSKPQLPPIHIHMNTAGANQSPRANDRARRDSFSATSPDYRKHKFSAEPMSREGSWDRHSGTASINDTSSVHTADDSVFSETERRRSTHRSDIVSQPPKLRSRNLPHRQEGFGYPHTSHIYGDVEPRTRRSAYPTPNDYAHQRDYFDDAYTTRPGLHRRSSVHTPQSNPFDTARYPARLPRSSTFNEPVYGPREPRYVDDRAAAADVNMADLAEALNHIKESRRRPLASHTRRASEYERERVGGYAGGYDMYGRGY